MGSMVSEATDIKSVGIGLMVHDLCYPNTLPVPMGNKCPALSTGRPPHYKKKISMLIEIGGGQIYNLCKIDVFMRSLQNTFAQPPLLQDYQHNYNFD